MSNTLILLSGLLSDKSVWSNQVTSLQNICDIQVIDFLEEDTSHKMVEKILDIAPPTFDLAGHSMGGWLALEVAKVAKERIHKLCLLNTTARKDTPQKLQQRYKMIDDVKNGLFIDVATQIANKFVFNQAVKPIVLDMFLRVGPQAFINQQQAMIMHDECLSVLKQIHCPALVIHAQQDQNFNLAMHEEMAAQLQTKVQVVEPSGHMSIMEVPDKVTDLMRNWLIY